MIFRLQKERDCMKNHASSGRQWKILYVEESRDGTIGGSHISLLNLIRGLDKSKYDPVVIFFVHHQLISEYLAAGAEIHIFSPPPTFSFRLKANDNSSNGRARVLEMPISTFRRAFNFFSGFLVGGVLRSLWFIWKERIDLIHLNNGAPIGYGWLVAAKLARKKCIGHQRGIIPHCPSRRLIIRIRRLIRMLDAAISVSNIVKETLEKWGAICGKNVVIHNALPQESLIPQDELEENKKGLLLHSDPRIGIIGNIKHWKGQRVVLEALAMLTGKYPGIKCFVVGDTSPDSADYLEELISLISRRGIEENVVFTGYRQDIANILRSLDVVVHASITPEPFGRIIIEGMAMGKPVIATNIGGPREIIESGVTGMLVPPNDPAALAQALEQLFEDWPEALQMGKRAREHVKKHFSLKENVSKTEAVYESVLCSPY